jgi:hypothetical protein
METRAFLASPGRVWNAARKLGYVEQTGRSRRNIGRFKSSIRHRQFVYVKTGWPGPLPRDSEARRETNGDALVGTSEESEGATSNMISVLQKALPATDFGPILEWE